MSVELDVFPTLPTVICWGDVKDRLQELLGPLAATIGTSSGPIALGTHIALEPDEPFSLEGSYYLNLAIRNTLGITVMSNAGNVDELAYLEDYGRNLDSESVCLLADRWRSAGHYYEIQSLGGRSEHEPRILPALVVAIAEACQGYVILMNDGIFDLDVGVYTPEQFQKAEPRF